MSRGNQIHYIFEKQDPGGLKVAMSVLREDGCLAQAKAQVGRGIQH